MEDNSKRPQDLWLAYELHDGLIQWLFSAKMLTESAISRLEEASLDSTKAKLADVLKCLNSATQEGRDLIRHLEFGAEADARDFATTLQEMTSQIAPRLSDDQSVNLKMADPCWPEFDDTTTWNLLRIIQQSVNNAIQHAGPCEITVQTGWQDTETIFASIRDTGCGFETERPTSPTSFGLSSLQHRARKIAADLKIESSAGKGTVVTITMPIQGHASSTR